MELWDLYNAQRRLVGADHIRGEELPDNCFHLVVHVWIRNHQGQYLLSQRAADRPTFPLLWECVGGSVQKGETSLQGALREVKEEVGLTLDGPRWSSPKPELLQREKSATTSWMYGSFLTKGRSLWKTPPPGR